MRKVKTALDITSVKCSLTRQVAFTRLTYVRPKRIEMLVALKF